MLIMPTEVVEVVVSTLLTATLLAATLWTLMATWRAEHDDPDHRELDVTSPITEEASLTAVVCDTSTTGLIYIRWPPVMRADGEYDTVALTLHAAETPFGLVHDCRGSDFSSVKSNCARVIQDATDITRRGMVKRAAVIVDIGPFLRSMLNAFLGTLSLVPMQVFSEPSTACAWAQQCGSDHKGVGAGASVAAAETHVHHLVATTKPPTAEANLPVLGCAKGADAIGRFTAALLPCLTACP